MNQFINLFWTALGFAAVFAYWFSEGLSAWFYLFIGLSTIPAFLSRNFFDRIQLSRNAKFYERLGVRFIRKFVQHGDFATRLARKSHPAHPIIRQIVNPEGYLSTIAMYERFHFVCFAFFLLTSIVAMVQGRYLAALTIVMSNGVYNVCPILLQQFNRIRVLNLHRRQVP